MPPHDFGAVAVIDGRTLKITPFKTANMPPPMSMFELEASRTVVDVAFAQDNSSMAVLHHGGIDLYSWQIKNGRSVVPRFINSYDFDVEGVVENALQISFAPGGKPFVLYFKNGLKVCGVIATNDSDKPTVGSHVSLGEEASFLQANSRTRGSEQGHGVCVQTKAGRLLSLRGQCDTFEATTVGFPVQLPWVEISEIEEETVAFGLSRSGHLYANSRLLVKNCTSFLVTCDHLIFTTSNHLLKFVHLCRVEGMSQRRSF